MSRVEMCCLGLLLVGGACDEGAQDGEESTGMGTGLQSRDQYEGDAGGYDSQMVDLVWDCQHRAIDDCEDDSCALQSGWRYDASKECFGPEDEAAVCLPRGFGSGDAQSCVVDAEGELWLFGSGPEPFPLGWRAASSGDLDTPCDGNAICSGDAG